MWCATKRAATRHVLRASYPTTTTVDTLAPLQPPLRKNHQQLPQTRPQPLRNLQAMKKRPSHPRTMTHLLPQSLFPMLPVVENVATGMLLQANADAQRFVAVGTVSRVGFHGVRGCSISLP